MGVIIGLKLKRGEVRMCVERRSADLPLGEFFHIGFEIGFVGRFKPRLTTLNDGQ